jgi:hypothetical protein
MMYVCACAYMVVCRWLHNTDADRFAVRRSPLPCLMEFALLKDLPPSATEVNQFEVLEMYVSLKDSSHPSGHWARRGQGEGKLPTTAAPSVAGQHGAVVSIVPIWTRSASYPRDASWERTKGGPRSGRTGSTRPLSSKTIVTAPDIYVRVGIFGSGWMRRQPGMGRLAESERSCRKREKTEDKNGGRKLSTLQ